MESSNYQPLPARQVLASHVRLLRVMRRWSQENLADLADLHRTYIGALERGEKNPCLDTIEKIAKAFEVPVQSLFDERFDYFFGANRNRIEEPHPAYGNFENTAASFLPPDGIQRAA